MYETLSGDTFDLIAYRLLGSEHFTPELLAANPDYVRVFVFDAGVKLNIPSVQSSTNQPLLPWRS